mgnify:CR=1 FL=1
MNFVTITLNPRIALHYGILFVHFFYYCHRPLCLSTYNILLIFKSIYQIDIWSIHWFIINFIHSSIFFCILFPIHLFFVYVGLCVSVCVLFLFLFWKIHHFSSSTTSTINKSWHEKSIQFVWPFLFFLFYWLIESNCIFSCIINRHLDHHHHQDHV